MLNVVLFEPEIPQNTGNIMRTCVATNARLHLIRPLGFHLDEHHLKRAGVNYIKDLDYVLHDSFDDFLKTVEEDGELYYFTRYGKKTHDSFDYKDKKNIYLIFGKESTGIPKEILRNNLNRCIRIPMSDKTRALNLSNCVAICVYEVLRQKDYPNLFREETQKSKDYLIED